MSNQQLGLEIFVRSAAMLASVGMFATAIVGHVRWNFAPPATVVLALAAVLLFSAACQTAPIK